MASRTEVSAVTTSLQLVLPPDPQLLRIVRLVASGLASLTQLGLDAVEEIRVAADELVSTLIEASGGEPVVVDLALTDSALRLEASTTLAEGQTLTVDPMTDRILDKVATSHEWGDAGGTARGVVERSLTS
jgi:hypothetical protein